MSIHGARANDSSNGRRRCWWSRLVGVDPQDLEDARSERAFYRSLSVIVAFVSVVSGVAVTVTVGYWVGQPPLRVCVVGLVWMSLMLFGIEPLMLHVATAHSRWWLLPAIAPRLLLTVLLAVAVTEPLLLSLNRQAIDDYLSRHNTEQIRQASTAADRYYAPRITKDHSLINAMRGQETRLRNALERDRFRGERASDPVEREHYLRLAAEDQRRLDAAIERHGPRLASARRDIGELTRRMDAETLSRRATITADTGLKAREHALSALKAQDGSLRSQVWFLRVFFFVIDLLPLTIKITRVLTVTSSVEAYLDARRQAELTDALRRKETALGEWHRIDVDTRARRDVHETTVRARTEAIRGVTAERWRAWGIGEVNRVWSRFRGERVSRDDVRRGNTDREAA